MKTLNAVAVLLFITACQNSPEETNEFSKTKLSVELQEQGEGIQLTDLQAPLAYVSKAELWCDDTLRTELEFTNDNKSVELFSGLDNCELHLKEFYFGGTYKIGELHSEGIYQFDLRDEATNDLIDRKLVRSVQPIYYALPQHQCPEQCPETREAQVTFPHSVLDIKKEVLVNDVSFSKLEVGLEEEPAPICDSVHAKFVESTNPFEAPFLQVELNNCLNTINTTDLEFAIGPTTLDQDGNLPGNITVVDALNAIDNFPVIAEQDGNNYKIIFTFQDLKDNFTDTSVLTYLTFDYAVVIKNQGGISGLVYLLENECELIGGLTPLP